MILALTCETVSQSSIRQLIPTDGDDEPDALSLYSFEITCSVLSVDALFEHRLSEPTGNSSLTLSSTITDTVRILYSICSRNKRSSDSEYLEKQQISYD